MSGNIFSQNHVYDENGNKINYTNREIELEFIENSDVRFPIKPVLDKPILDEPVPDKSGQKFGPDAAATILSVIPTVIDLGFKLTTKFLEDRIKKYTAEYTKKQSYLGAGDGSIPDLIFTHSIKKPKNSRFDTAIEFSFKARQVNNLNGFVYYINKISVNYSEAKVSKKDNTLDYTIELKPIFLINGEKKVQELSPISITSVEFQNEPFTDPRHRTDIIPLPEGGMLSEVSIKLIESNPAQVKSEKILEIFNKSQEDIKTIINNFIPKPEEDEEPEQET